MDELLGTHWTMLVTAADEYAAPSQLPAVGADGTEAWLTAPVPGTVAQALEPAGRFSREHPAPLDERDAWYVRRLSGSPGPAVLEFDGLATWCDIFVNDAHVMTTENMFRRYRVPVELTGDDRLALCFRALGPRLVPPGPRARWRQQLAEPRTLKNVRTTLLGRMPGWCPSVQAVGPWRPVHLRRDEPVTAVDLTARLDEAGTGHLGVRMRGRLEQAERPRIRCAGVELDLLPCDTEPDTWTAELDLPGVPAWWPHTHGSPTLHDVTLVTTTSTRTVGRTGFRRLDLDRGADGGGFGMLVNGVPVFCRGAVWTTADVVRLPGGRADYEPWLRLARDGGMNLIRVGGTMAYESADFFALCDELGIMVWQDFMFANFDYPTGEEFVESVRAEARDLLAGVRAAPSLVVLCGGSEVHQQAAMVGRPNGSWTHRLFDEVLPDVAARVRPDVVYVPNSPFGGSTPFTPRTAVTHYYGVGAYQRPLADARLAGVRFAAECLAFSQLPQESALWRQWVPRDRGASWDFADVRDFYLALLYDVADPQRLRRRDLDRYLALSQAVTGEVMEHAYAEWRRPGSSCRGALVWNFQDLMPGAGWGVVDSTGEPKPAWYALRRAWRPAQVLLTDEGTNGVDVHVLNDGPMALLDAELEIVCLRDGAQPVMRAQLDLRDDPPGPHSGRSMACTDLFGAFFDTNHAFAFGSPTHDAVVARLSVGGCVVSESVLFPLGRAAALHPQAVLTADLHAAPDGGWAVELSTDRLAQSVHLAVDGYRPEDDWFHLTPGRRRRIRLHPRPGTDVTAVPRGSATPLTGATVPMHARLR